MLVVDDNPVNLKLLRVLLTSEGLAVRTAGHAEQALEAIRASPPRLILMDVQLPGISGLEATQRLKADPATANIPIIALTAQALSGDREKGLEAGCDEYETKPIDLPRLLGKMRALLQK